MGYSIDDLAGQRMMFGFEGTTLNAQLKTLIQEHRAGGIILFKSNIETPPQLKQLCHDAQAFARDCGLPPLFIAVDQEGGTVARLRHPWTEFPGNRHIQTSSDAREFAVTTAKDLKEMGINMNMAPVLDVVDTFENSIMKERAFPGDIHTVSRLGKVVISALQDRGIMAVAKHFPGIGRTVLDSHYTLPVLKSDLEEMKRLDIPPFEMARDAGVTGVMVSHIFYPDLDDTWQASLSPRIAKEILREQLGYQGLVLTDDMDMLAVALDIEVCIQQIVKADIDLTLICHWGPNIARAVNEVRRLLASDADLMERGRQSLDRILGAKKDYIPFG